MTKNQETKLMIIQNYIDWYTTDEAERKQLKDNAYTYVLEDHVDEIGVPNKVDSRIKRAYGILVADTDAEIEAMIKAIEGSQLHETIDYIDGVVVWEKVEYQFNGKAFLEYISD